MLALECGNCTNPSLREMAETVSVGIISYCKNSGRRYTSTNVPFGVSKKAFLVRKTPKEQTLMSVHPIHFDSFGLGFCSIGLIQVLLFQVQTQDQRMFHC